jgi:hypothetical protein
MTDPNMEKMRNIATANWRQRIAKIDPHKATETEEKMFYALVRQIKWLPDKIRYAVMAELGPGVRTPKNELNKRWAGFLRFRISEREKEMKANGEKLRGLKTRAKESIAAEEGMSIDTMIRKLQIIEERRRGERSKR